MVCLCIVFCMFLLFVYFFIGFMFVEKQYHLWITIDGSPPPPLSYDNDVHSDDYDDNDNHDYDDDDDDNRDFYDDDDDNRDYDDDHHWLLSTNNPPTSLESTLTSWG